MMKPSAEDARFIGIAGENIRFQQGFKLNKEIRMCIVSRIL